MREVSIHHGFRVAWHLVRVVLIAPNG